VQALLDELSDDMRRRALTHPAFARSRADSFERLEFLGDSVLGLAITEALYLRYPDLPEGDLTRLRAAAVSRDSCAQVARDHDLGAAMVELAAARGEAHRTTAERLAQQRNALAALTEGVIGASFLEHGYEAAARHVLAAFEGRIEYALDNRIDARSQLQELASRDGAHVTWDELGEDGPPHDRTFTVAVQVADEADGRALQATGSGRSKQEAQQAAAAALLSLMDRDQG